MTLRENTLLAMTGGKPEYPICSFCDVQSPFTSAHGEALPFGVLQGKDGYGVPLTMEGGGVIPAPGVPPVIEDVCCWRDSLVMPDYRSVDWAAEAARNDRMHNTDPEHFVQDFIYPKGPFERLHFLLGFEEALMAVVAEPEATFELLTAITDNKVAFIHRIAEAFHPDFITVMDDYAQQNGLFLSPGTFRTLFKPQLKKLVDAVHEHGVRFKLHCCGKMEDLADDFLDLGIDALDPAQPINDIPALQRKLAGKAGICGGLDVQNVVDRNDVTEEEIRAEAQRCIDSYSGIGGYVLYGASLYMREPGNFRIRAVNETVMQYRR